MAAVPATGAAAEADANKDGVITEAEAAAFLKELKEKNPSAYAELEELNKKNQPEVGVRAIGGGGGSSSSSALGMLGPLLGMLGGGSSGGSSFGSAMGSMGSSFNQQPSQSQWNQPSGFGQQQPASFSAGGGFGGGFGGNTAGANLAQCPRNYNHQMLVKSIQTQWRCDGCGSNGMAGAAHYRCDADNLDFCQNCRPINGMGGGFNNQQQHFDPRGHAMTFKSINTIWNCDRCRRQGMAGQIHARCDACNYDVCTYCVPVPGVMGGGGGGNFPGQPNFPGVVPNPNPPPGFPGGNMGGGFNNGIVQDPRGHQMQQRSIQTPYNCDRCGRQRQMNEYHMRCDMCNIDYCPNCVSSSMGGGFNQGGGWNQGGGGWNQGGYPNSGGYPQSGGSSGGGLGGLLGSLLGGGSLSGLMGSQGRP